MKVCFSVSSQKELVADRVLPVIANIPSPNLVVLSSQKGPAEVHLLSQQGLAEVLLSYVYQSMTSYWG